MLAVFGQFVFPALLGFVAFFCIITCIHYAANLARTFSKDRGKVPLARTRSAPAIHRTFLQAILAKHS